MKTKGLISCGAAFAWNRGLEVHSAIVCSHIAVMKGLLR